MKTDYFLAEFRFPYTIDGKKTIQQVADEAIKKFKDQYGFAPDKWNLRVFEFSSKAGDIGAQREYFFSPSGVTVKEIGQNHD